jgi:divalent metal cation (Fe/Co/Zn/Cd) transporter
MGMASLQVIIQSVQDIMKRATETVPPITVDSVTWGILGAVIGTKLVLFLFCRVFATKSASVAALSQDHFNDTIMNGLSVLAVGLASRYKSVWWLDPGFAILASMFIIFVWSNTGKGEWLVLLSSLRRRGDVCWDGQTKFASSLASPPTMSS